MMDLEVSGEKSEIGSQKPEPVFFLICALCSVFCILFLINSSFGEDKEVHIVKIKDFNFHPAELIISEGDAVLWINEMPYGHWVISGADMKHDNRYFSPLLLKDHKFNYTFEEPVVQDYYCPIHSMQGRITVLERKDKVKKEKAADADKEEKKEPQRRRRVRD